ncbi:MAG: DUF4179 domain-containing protein, partial [Lachnospiraceae bacterium]|nr:DUF4179 domain-containing protein [Lachnospiraceae bacterium]
MQDNELREILSVNLAPSRIIDARIEEAYDRIRNAETTPTGGRNRHARRFWAGMGSVAAVLAVMVTVCVMNPVMAKELPIVGGIFNKLSELFMFGQIPESETVVLFQEEESAANQASDVEDEKGQNKGDTAAYQKTFGDITITLTEEYATNQALFIGVNIKNAQEFPQMAVYPNGTQNMALETKEQYSFRPDVVSALRYVEGKLTDTHTFEGILRIDYSEINVDETKYQQALEEKRASGEELWLTDENYFQYMDEYEVPVTFAMKLDITNVVGTLGEPLPLPAIE